MKILIAVYGSLRRGELNSREDLEYQRTTQIQGFKLYDLLVGYPGASLGIDELLTVDTALVTPQKFAQLNNMEYNAGYELEAAKTLDGEEVLVWRMPLANMSAYYPDAQLVPSGDWTQHLDNQETILS